MFRLSPASLHVRLIVVALVAILPAIGLAFYTGLEQRHASEVNAQATALRLAQLAAANHQQLIESARQILTALAELPQLQKADPDFCQAFLVGVAEKHLYYADLGMVTLDGDWVCQVVPTPRPSNVADQSWFQEILRSRDFVIGNYELYPSSDSTVRATIHLAYPVLDDANQLHGVVVLALNLTWLNRLAAEMELPAGAALTVVDGQGVILARQPDPDQWVGQAALEAPLIAAILSERGEGTVQAVGLDGVPRLFAFVPLDDTRPASEAYVAIGIPESVAFAEANQTLARNLLGLGLAAAAALGAAWVIGELLILRTVQSLLQATRRLATGDYGARTGVKDRRGEFGELAHAFDEMAAALQQEKTEREHLFNEVQRLAVTDELTGLHNRRHFFELAGREFKRCARLGRPVSAIMLDIDHFKQVNDTYGHAVGDDVLRVMAERCVATVRAIDILGRYGGEEFALLLPEADLASAWQVGERLVQTVAEHPFPTRQGALSITISAGVAGVTDALSDLALLLNAADEALYAAKRAGRNRAAVG